MEKTTPDVRYLQDYQPADFIIHQVHLHFELDEEHTKVQSILEMSRNPVANTPTAALVLHGENMQLQRVALNGKELQLNQYQGSSTLLTIPNVPPKFTLETEVIIEPQKNTRLMGLYKSRNNFCTQCEAEGFRHITYYLDRPDVMSRFTTTISADKDKYPMLLSNGNLMETKLLSGNRHWVRWEDPSLKPCYLFALVAGDFDLLESNFTTMSGRNVELQLYLEKGFADQGQYALESLKKAMRWDEERWGREYDLNIYMIVAVSDFNMGAMENKGLNIFNTKYILAKPETATDADYVAILDVIGHEYFHNWSGNRVTCRNWFQITLKEGLTVFRDQSFTEDMISEGTTRIDEVSVVRNVQFAEDAGPMAHPIRPESYIEVNNFYTPTVYRKGAEVIRMVQTLIGREKFREGMDLYFSRHDGQAVTTEDFIQAMMDVSEKDFTQFKRWYSQAGTPVLDVSGIYDEAQQTFTLKVKQSCSATPGQPNKQSLHLPLTVGLVSDGCEDAKLQLQGEEASSGTTRVLEITQPEQSFHFIHVRNKPVPSLLRHFSAPVKLNYPYTDSELAWLLQCDSDAFSRWEAGQKLSQNIIFQLVGDIQQNKPLQLNPNYLQAYKKLLAHPAEDLTYFSRLLVLPTLSYLLQQMQVVDVDALIQAYHFVRQELALGLESDFLKYYNRHKSDTPYYFDVGQMGQRSFSNICLFYLTETQKPQYFNLTIEAYNRADNMTDMIGALAALNNHDCKERDLALDTFYHRWQNDPLVVNKWLLLQASSNLSSTLGRVHDLLKPPAFDMRNPNNVYALICGFGANIPCFHDISGAGYHFIAEQVLAIQMQNPQVGARVLQPLIHWQHMDAIRGALMKQELERISQAPQLSKDIYEIIDKSLAV